MSANDGKEFFSVKQGILVGRTQYRPSICYPLNLEMRKSIYDLAADGKATVYPNAVRFVSGVARKVEPTAEEHLPQRSVQEPKSSSLVAPVVVGVRPLKKSKKVVTPPVEEPAEENKDFE